MGKNRDLFVLSVFIFLLFFFNEVSAQMSPGTKFKKIDTEHYEVIFPDNMANQAGELASQLDKNYDYINVSLGLKGNYKISIILNNKVAVSNAYVTLAPEYGMFYTLPPQLNIHELYYDNWLKLLAVHETRHAAQFHKLNHGFNRFLYIVFGDLGLAAGMGLSAPGWFFEGDAVFMETALTGFGRGRLASFPLLTRSMLLSGETPDYEQMYLGSDLIEYPNIYEFGYLMTAWLRQQYGDDVYDDILNESSSWDGLVGPYGFHLGVYTKTGKSLFENYNDLLGYLTKTWKLQLKDLNLTTFETVKTAPKSYFTNYYSPQPDHSNNFGSAGIIAYKKGKFNRGAIVQISAEGREKIVAFTGALSGSVSINSKSIFWSEVQPDIRWSESVSALKCYDRSRQKVFTIPTNGRIFAPSVSADDRHVAAMEVEPNGDTWLVVFEKTTGPKIALVLRDKVKAPAGLLWQTPRFGDNPQKVALVESGPEGKTIIVYDLVAKQFYRSFRHMKHQVSDPYIFDNFIAFHSDIKGIDNIFVTDEEGKIRQITSVALGAFYPAISADRKHLYFSSFTRMGYDIARMPLAPETWQPVGEKDLEEKTMFDHTDPSKKNQAGSIFNDPGIEEHKISHYSDLANFFNFHSRYIDPIAYLVDGDIKLGLISANKLQTQFVDLAYTYRTLEDSHTGMAAWTFAGWFPLVSVGGLYGNRNYMAPDLNAYSWTEKGGYAEVALPFLFSRGPVTQRIYALAGTSAISIGDFTSTAAGVESPNGSNYSAIWVVQYTLELSGNPRLFDHPYFNLGWSVSNKPRFSWFNERGWSWDESAFFSIPGFFNNNRITIAGAGSQKSPEGAQDMTSLQTDLARAALQYPYTQRYSVSAEYGLPLAYPDKNLWHILYFKQARLNLFYEHHWVKPQAVNPGDWFRTNYLGGEFLLVFNIFHLKSDIVGGVRALYDPQRKAWFVSPVLSLSINVAF